MTVRSENAQRHGETVKRSCEEGKHTQCGMLTDRAASTAVAAASTRLQQNGSWMVEA